MSDLREELTALLFRAEAAGGKVVSIAGVRQLLDRAALEVDDCRFRMLKPREQLRTQRFHDSYVVHGTITEQTMQAGNAVSANAAQWLGDRVCRVLGGRSSGEPIGANT